MVGKEKVSMHPLATPAQADYSTLTDLQLVERVLAGFNAAFRQLMQRSNQRLFRIARGVVNDDSEAEDVVQEAYLHAFSRLRTFRGESSVLTWLTRIVLNEAYGRMRERKSTTGIEQLDVMTHGSDRVIPFPGRFGVENPADLAGQAQIRHMLEQAVSELDEPFRLVFILRDIEECTIEETAQALGIRAETVKTRLHRARRKLRDALQDSMRSSLNETFPFLGARCAGMTDRVLARIEALAGTDTGPDTSA
jgi:RNA polymerase sigma-70 factor (ECF subfamily)